MASTLSEEQIRRLGRDLLATYGTGDGRQGSVDLGVRITRRGGGSGSDLDLASGIDNAVQAIVHRINTRRGELAPLGHAAYGSRHHDLIGEPNTEHNRQLVKLFVLQALAEESRIEKIQRAAIRYARELDASRVDIELDIKLGATDEVVNLVVPFFFEVAP